MIPIPLIFIRYGASLRARSHHAQEANAIVTRMRAAAAAAATKAEQDRVQDKPAPSSPASLKNDEDLEKHEVGAIENAQPDADGIPLPVAPDDKADSGENAPV